jgi:hypothetical protein
MLGVFVTQVENSPKTTPDGYSISRLQAHIET